MDLNEPLGMKPPTRPRWRYGLLVGSTLSVAAVACLGYVIATGDPLGGEPYASTSIPPRAAKQVAASVATDPAPTGSIAPAVTDPGIVENGVKIVRGIHAGQTADRPQSGPLVIDVSKVLDDPDRKQKTTGTQVVSNATPTGARIAIFVGGMGLSEAATKTAIDTMPAGVTLAFVPYGASIEALVGTARAKGHEVLLQLPMQSGQGAALGPHTLRADESTAETKADLDWILGRFHDYAGVTNLLGGPVTSNTATMTDILKTVGGRGLFYLDDGTSRRSVSAALAPGLGVAAAQADIVLDATSDPHVVHANLDALVAIARRKGSAIGMASGLPDHMAAIARYASDLAGQGVTLVSVSAVVRNRADVAASR
jgi:polysaccharide deacetylase 2 family uncharacterized protein YibQ